MPYFSLPRYWGRSAKKKKNVRIYRITEICCQQVRQIVSDFAVIIAIFSMSMLDHFVGIGTPKLEVPQEFKPTLDGRGWVIWPFQENPWWSAIVAALPALLGTILIFMDQQITAVIVNRKENKLKVRQSAKLVLRFLC